MNGAELLFYGLAGFWWISEIFVSLSKRSRGTAARATDRSSMFLISAAVITSLSAGVTVNHYCAPINLFGIALPSFWKSTVSIVMMTMGLVLRTTAVFTLRKQFTVNVSVIEGHELINHGIYRFIRHPSYVGSIMSFASIGVFWGNWMSLIALILPMSAAYTYRIRIEEQVLFSHFGQKYSDYAKTTKRFIPFLF